MFRYLTSTAVCLTATGLALAQQPQPTAPPQPAPPPIAAPIPTGPVGQPCDATYSDVLTTPSAPRFWASGEFLVWWVEGQQLPPLLTTSPAGTPAGQAGILGLPTTTVLIGNSEVNGDARLGGRFTAGYWLDDCQRWGIGGEFFFLGDSNESFAIASPGNPILARPFINSLTGAQDAQLIAFPGVANGSFAVSSSNEILGAAGYVTRTLCCTCNARFGVLAGYRYLRMEEEIAIAERLTAQAGGTAVPAGTTFLLSENYRALNQFHGGDIGLTGRVHRGSLFFDGMARLGIGVTRREVSVAGATTIQPPGGAATTLPGALLVQGTPVTVRDDAFSLVPEFRLAVGYHLTDSLSVFAAYNLMWWTNVARAADQIGLQSNPALIPPPVGPTGPATVTLRDSTMWIQGVSVGLAWNY